MTGRGGPPRELSQQTGLAYAGRTAQHGQSIGGGVTGGLQSGHQLAHSVCSAYKGRLVARWHRRLRIEQTKRQARQLGPPPAPSLVTNPVQVRPDGADADEQTVRDRLIRQAASHEVHQLPLTRSEPATAAIVVRLALGHSRPLHRTPKECPSTFPQPSVRAPGSSRVRDCGHLCATQRSSVWPHPGLTESSPSRGPALLQMRGRARRNDVSRDERLSCGRGYSGRGRSKLNNGQGRRLPRRACPPDSWRRAWRALR